MQTWQVPARICALTHVFLSLTSTQKIRLCLSERFVSVFCFSDFCFVLFLDLLTTDIFTGSVGGRLGSIGQHFSSGWNKGKMSLTTQGPENPAVLFLFCAILLGGVGGRMRIHF